MDGTEGPGEGTREVKGREGSSHAKQNLKIATAMRNPATPNLGPKFRLQLPHPSALATHYAIRGTFAQPVMVAIANWVFECAPRRPQSSRNPGPLFG